MRAEKEMTSSKRLPLILSIFFLPVIINLLGCYNNHAKPVPTHDDYLRLAREIASDLIALRKQIPYLAEIELDVDQQEASHEFRVHLFSLHGQTGTKPNPKWTPAVKAPRTIPVYSRDGLRLNVNLFIGSYSWAQYLHQESIGLLQINYYADGPMKDNALRELRSVLDKHRGSFVKEYEL